ncbi:hypothetical protein DSO57_1003388 [Entomophthora muscae]|uniref:Uncharacterized protein n=1 Tax=Entomophthora muscae TaxID=34485 RepID=A0ACC2TJ77_9FUNG|nr:hypothetical protein DSO57_1003388 [Entomophthora muscae]
MMDYMRYVMNKEMPSIFKGAASYYNEVLPQKTKLQFKHATVKENMPNFNKSLVSNCPVCKSNCNACTSKATYSNEHLFEDKLFDAVAVVLNNNI